MKSRSCHRSYICNGYGMTYIYKTSNSVESEVSNFIVTGVYREYSNTLLTFILATLRPSLPENRTYHLYFSLPFYIQVTLPSSIFLQIYANQNLVTCSVFGNKILIERQLHSMTIRIYHLIFSIFFIFLHIFFAFYFQTVSDTFIDNFFSS